jgi:hypothetical protein
MIIWELWQDTPEARARSPGRSALLILGIPSHGAARVGRPLS